MSRCTCTIDNQMTCIVHPTTRSLKERIAELEAENAELRLEIIAATGQAQTAYEDYTKLKEAARAVLVEAKHGPVELVDNCMDYLEALVEGEVNNVTF